MRTLHFQQGNDLSCSILQDRHGVSRQTLFFLTCSALISFPSTKVSIICHLIPDFHRSRSKVDPGIANLRMAGSLLVVDGTFSSLFPVPVTLARRKRLQVLLCFIGHIYEGPVPLACLGRRQANVVGVRGDGGYRDVIRDIRKEFSSYQQ